MKFKTKLDASKKVEADAAEHAKKECLELVRGLRVVTDLRLKSYSKPITAEELNKAGGDAKLSKEWQKNYYELEKAYNLVRKSIFR